MADADYVEWAANETTDVLRYRLRFTNRSNWSRGHQYTGSTLSGIVNSKRSALQFELEDLTSALIKWEVGPSDSS